MTPTSRRKPAKRFGAAFAPSLLVAVLGLATAHASHSQDIAAPVRAASKPAPAAAEQGVKWRELKPAQQATLKPLEREWAVISSPHKQKWLELSTRFPSMTAPEQARVQERMAEWARLTSQERSQARLNFQDAKQLSPQDRQQRWDAYQALSPEQRQQFAARAAPASAGSADASRKAASGAARSDKRELPQAKSNIVPNPALAAPPKPIAPSVVQARPGATTTLITKRPTPPVHQQTGLPKIAATPEFVNKATLLPQRGPQGAATRSAAAASAVPVPAQR
jgi:Protein of unknown function (DUF3106)